MEEPKSKYSKGEFLEIFGSKFARCEIRPPHIEHSWHGNVGWWWCGGEELREAPHDAPDPFLPHKLCSRETPHKAHDWVWDDRPMTRYHCAGRTFDPEATLHEGNQPGDFILDLSPDIPESLLPKPTDTLPDRSMPEPTDTLHAGNQTPEVERVFEEIRETRRREHEEAQGWDPSQGDGTPEGLPSPEEAMEILRAKMENRALPVRWADRAMFKAEPIKPEEGPKVYLLWMTPDPLGAIAAACKMYKGEVVRDLSTITDEERLEYLAQVNRTKLKAPFEFVQFHFMIEGVTRSFTHQMVRQRTAAYAQESLRFAVVGEEDGTLPVGLPPSLSGLPEDDSRRIVWEDATETIGNAYQTLVENGVPAEDARGLLPHNIMTRLNYTTNLRALLDHAGNRLCTQAQFEWRLVFSKIVEAIRNAENHAAGPVDIVGSPGYVKMARELTSLFKPVCYQTGKCEFKANFDRACSIRDRVDANAAINRPPSQWEEPYDNPTGIGGEGRIAPIKPGEWLLDPKAARRK